MSTDAALLAAAAEYSDKGTWAEHSKQSLEFLTIINDKLEVLFTNRTPPGVESAVGLSCLGFLPPEQQEQFRISIEKTIATGLPWHYETQAVGPHGVMSYYSGWATLLSGAPENVRVALIGTDISHVRRVEEELALSDETLRSLVSGASDYIAVVDREHKLTFINKLHYNVESEVIGQPIESFVTEGDREMISTAIDTVFRCGTFESYQTTVVTEKEQGRITQIVSSRLSPLYSGDEVVAVTVVGTDITQQTLDQAALRDSQERLRQSQQLQSIGQLTGGIAHDFNNLLMVMQGSLQLAQYSIEDKAETLELIGDAMQAAERAAELTQRLLAFGRRQSLQPITIDTAKLLVSLSAMMRRTLGTQVTIETEAEAEIWPCYADQVQLESALLNLAINARDALGIDGGLLRIVASNWTVKTTPTDDARDLEPGDYLRIDVSDNGPGIEGETLSRAFEPFFTTKDISRGSGLGLSMVYGFTQQSGGHVSISSEVGKGTMVSVFLPKGVDSTSQELTPCTEPVTAGLETHVLMVEDVPAVARVTKQILELHGYRVSAAENGEAALSLLSTLSDATILLTDIGLPGRLNGVALSHEILARRPDMLVLFMTGFDNGLLDSVPEASVLKKPFGAHALVSALEELIASSG